MSQAGERLSCSADEVMNIQLPFIQSELFRSFVVFNINVSLLSSSHNIKCNNSKY